MEAMRGFVRGVKSNLIDSSVLHSPKYNVVHELGEYELRHYPSTKWVATALGDQKTGGENFEKAGGQSFWRLFNYITGQNDAKQKIEMTTPVLQRIVPGAGPACESKGEMMFYIPPEFHDNCPEPTNKPDVYLQDLPELNVYVYRFGGRVRGEEWFKKAAEFANMLEKDGKTSEIDDRSYFVVGYNSPFQMFNRRNEVWYIKKD